ncbi:uncharacterized protein LOC131875395 isoform X1 [Cryptomeria japonica]|uniref:uncharacterized protein LOC131875395 isoform X1 n=1 Tax=Cryptomeria japonica TaxID=3369 RepID=UPI0027DA2C6D|nr:uncharacterized protein LOC131875395 isoform X1 [Cryptomeria japonica]
MDLGFLEELVRNVIHVDHLIYIFDQHLQAIAAKNERKFLQAQQNRFTQLVDHHVSAERKRLDEVVDFIFDGCAQYLAQMESHRLYRVFQDSVDVGDLQKLESEIRNTDLSLGAVIGVLNKTPRLFPPTEGHDPKSVGREVAKYRIIKKMDPTDDLKRAVLIYGIGGIGKTNLASEVFKTLDLKAYKYCRLDMDENCSNDVIKHLQQQILRDLFGQGNVVSNSYEHGQNQLREAFRINSIDRIVMFINSGFAVLTDLSCLPSGMRILLTTRKLDQTDLSCFSSGMRILVTTRKLDQIDLSCFSSGTRILVTTRKLYQNGMRILLTIRKLDQTDKFSRTDFEGVPYEVGSVKAF